MKKIIVIALPSGEQLLYSSIAAVLLDDANPIDITDRRWSQIVKKMGYPFDYDGCRVSLHYAKSVGDVRQEQKCQS